MAEEKTKPHNFALIGIGNGACHVGYASVTPAMSPFESEANARLITAAPDLLAALKEVEARLERWRKHGIAAGRSGKDNDWPTLLTQIHDALNKAEPKS
jgi:hypothetical protein